ncbi:MAG: hypothetical protein ACI4RK_07140, partial [Oscillospiraceae bacterium]
MEIYYRCRIRRLVIQKNRSPHNYVGYSEFMYTVFGQYYFAAAIQGQKKALFDRSAFCIMCSDQSLSAL